MLCVIMTLTVITVMTLTCQQMVGQRDPVYTFAHAVPHFLVTGAAGEILRVRQRDGHRRAGAAGSREPDGGRADRVRPHGSGHHGRVEGRAE